MQDCVTRYKMIEWLKYDSVSVSAMYPVIASFIMLKIMQWIFGLRILVELIKCVG